MEPRSSSEEMKSFLSHLRRSPHSPDDIASISNGDTGNGKTATSNGRASTPAQRRSVSYNGDATISRRGNVSHKTEAEAQDREEILTGSIRQGNTHVNALENDGGSLRSNRSRSSLSFARGERPLAHVFRRRWSGMENGVNGPGDEHGDSTDAHLEAASNATIGRRSRFAALGGWRQSRKENGSGGGGGAADQAEAQGDKPLPMRPKTRPTRDPPASPGRAPLAGRLGKLHLGEPMEGNGRGDNLLPMPPRIESPLPHLPNEEAALAHRDDQKSQSISEIALMDADATLRDRRRSNNSSSRKPLPHLATTSTMTSDGSRSSGYVLSQWSDAADFAALISAADPASAAAAATTTPGGASFVEDADSVTLEGEENVANEQAKRHVAFKSPDVTPAASVRLNAPPSEPSVVAAAPKRSFFRRRTSQPPFEVSIQEDATDAEQPLPSPSKRLKRSESGSSQRVAHEGSPKAKGRPPAKIRGFKRPSSPSALNARHTPVSTTASGLSPSFTPTSTTMAQGSGHVDRIAIRQSWAEITEDDLVANLSPRERTRQEALWEIVSSEDRYISDLIKLKTTFADALLQDSTESSSPYLLPDPLSPVLTNRSDSMQSMRSGQQHHARMASPSYTSFASDSEDGERLPIAARYASPRPEDDHPAQVSRSRGDSVDSAVVGLGFAMPIELPSKGPAPFGHVINGRPSWQGSGVRIGRGHHSLPPPPRQLVSPVMPNSSSAVNNRYSVFEGRKVSDDSTRARLASTVIHAAQTSTVARKLHKRDPSTDASVVGPLQLPESLRRVFKATSEILDGHMALWQDLNARYEDQYPLVRTFCDVFIAHSSIFAKYQEHILNLEDALNQVEDILHQPKAPKRASMDLHDPQAASKRRLAEVLKALDELAADQGESGLFISLSKPFHRLLRYPLMFQNLLFHTDPTTKEYDATIEIISQIETIVRHMEDEKWSQEQRAKTRDVMGRIEGLERDRQLAAPQSSRVLIDETPYIKPTPDGKSHKRLSDLLHKSDPESKMDLWAICFSDVILLCDKVGTTSLPLGTRGVFSAHSKSATAGRRSAQILPRNLYQYVRILEWKKTELPQADTSSSTQDQDTHAMSDSDESSDGLQPPPPPVSNPPSSRPVRASMPPPQKQDSPKAGEALPNTISGARPTRHARSSLPAPPQRAAATTTGRKISSEVVSSDAKFGHRLRSTEEGGRGTPRALPKTSTLMATTASQRAKAVTKPTSKPTAARSTPPLRPKTNVPGGTASQLTATPKGAAITPTSKRQYAPKAPGKRI